MTRNFFILPAIRFDCVTSNEIAAERERKRDWRFFLSFILLCDISSRYNVVTHDLRKEHRASYARIILNSGFLSLRPPAIRLFLPRPELLLRVYIVASLDR